MTVLPTREPVAGHDELIFGLRAPRVAIVFPAPADHWTYYARLALWEANRFWGGAGFVLVPHIDGNVSAVILEAVAAYDPDYVVTHRVSWRELAVSWPDAIPAVTDKDGNTVEGESKLDVLGEGADQEAIDEVTSDARDLVAAACEGYRRRTEEASEGPDGLAEVEKGTPPLWKDLWRDADEDVFTITTDKLTPITAFNAPDGMCLAVPETFGGPWRAQFATMVGTVARPGLPADNADVPEDELATLAAWMYSRIRNNWLDKEPTPMRLGHHPNGLALGIGGLEPYDAWERTRTGLTVVSEAGGGRRTTLVVGDTADDFALALISDRLWGRGVWIHSDWSPDAPGKVGALAGGRLEHDRDESQVHRLSCCYLRLVGRARPSKRDAESCSTRSSLHSYSSGTCEGRV